MAPTKKPSKSPSKPSTGIARVKGENFYRDARKAARVKMLTGGKPVRDKQGNVIQAAAFQKGEEFAKPGRVPADRRWFGNTRVISQDALEHFRNSMSVQKNDPYSVLLRRNKLPMSLLDDSSVGQKRPHIVETEPFHDTFGPKAQRKKPRIDIGSFEELSLASQKAGDMHDAEAEAKAAVQAKMEETSVIDGGHLGTGYAAGPEPGPSKPRGWTAHGAMSAVQQGYVPQVEPVFTKGTSRRIYGELYKVIDSSDVILHVLDARDPLGTLCQSVIDYVRKEKSHKQVVYIINKVDLVPGWVTQRYISYLTPQAPTLAFHASQTHSFGKGALIQLLRQFSQLHSDRKQISVGFVGYPNVGKSSIINCLKAGRVCSVAPIPGQTKVWQYITLMKRIYLIDCPGIAPASAHDSQTSKVLKGVVRVENLQSPSEHIPALLERVRPIYLERTYKIEGLMEKSVKDTAARRDDAPDLHSKGPVREWNADAFLDAVARKYGRLLKGGEPDRETVAKMVLNDWIRGNIPFFVRPPDSTNFLARQSQANDVVIMPKNAATMNGTINDEDEDVDTGEVEGEEWNGVVGDGDNGAEMAEEWSSSENDSSEEETMPDEPESKISKKARKREPKQLFVQQDVRGIVTKPKFVKDDRWNGEEADVGSSLEEEEEEDGADVQEEEPDQDRTGEVEAAAHLDWDDVFAAVGGLKTQQDELDGNEFAGSSASSVKGKEKALVQDSMSEDDDESKRYAKTIKDPRMTTNKRKAANFFTTANVKNRNRDRKIPQPSGLDERGKNGNRKAGGKGGRRR